jgi:MFS superfamily sulfate permease-like transporter
LLASWSAWTPKLWATLPGYWRRDFFADFIAGSVTPQAGIYTAIIGGFLVSFLGSKV